MKAEKKVGNLSVELDLDMAPLKRILKNLLTAIDASEKGTDVIPDFAGSKPPTFGVAVGGKLFSTEDIEAIREAIKREELNP